MKDVPYFLTGDDILPVRVLQKNRGNFADFGLQIKALKRRPNAHGEWLESISRRIIFELVNRFGFLVLHECELDMTRVPSSSLEHFRPVPPAGSPLFWHQDRPESDIEAVVLYQPKDTPERTAMTGLGEVDVVAEVMKKNRELFYLALEREQPMYHALPMKNFAEALRTGTHASIVQAVSHLLGGFRAEEFVDAVNLELENRAYWYEWKPGDALVFSNRRLMHSRKVIGQPGRSVPDEKVFRRWLYNNPR